MTLVYGYNESGFLVLFENCTWGMTHEQYIYALGNLRFALSVDNFREWVKSTGHQIIGVDIDLSFERFWTLYDMARNKVQAEGLWKKLKDTERQYVLYNIDAYKRYIKRNAWYSQLYPDTYLRTHIHDEWDKITTPEKGKKVNS